MARPVAVVPVCAGVVLQLYVKVPAPPEALTVAEPSLAPQEAGVEAESTKVIAAGCVIVTINVPVHKVASVAVTV